MRSVIKSVLRDHLGISPRRLDAEVFPSNAQPYLADLIRA
jgi:uncharacterized protein (DUF1501 family)